MTIPKLDLKALILDMDGVVWRGTEPIGDLPRIFSRIASAGLEVVFATNNSTLTINSYQDKLSGFGLTMRGDQVITSAEATAAYLRQNFPIGSRVFVIGEPGLAETLNQHEFTIEDDRVVAVVVGLDRDLTYEKLSTGMSLVEDGAVLIGTNPDKTLPQPGTSIPGAGAMIAAMEAATGLEAKIIGKPSPLMFEQALERLGINPKNAMVVGDRLETDIAGGQASGCHTALVLSGATIQAQADRWTPPPTIVADSLNHLVELIT